MDEYSKGQQGTAGIGAFQQPIDYFKPVGVPVAAQLRIVEPYQPEHHIEGIIIRQITAGPSEELKDAARREWDKGFGVWLVPVPAYDEEWEQAGGDEPGKPVFSGALSFHATVRGEKTFDEEWEDCVKHWLATDERQVWASTRHRMINRRMWELLDAGEAVDVGGFPRNEDGDYLFNPQPYTGHFIDGCGLDFCNARTESWIGSIGECREGPRPFLQ